MMREIGSMIFTLMNAVFLIRGLAGESVAAEAGLDVVRAEVDPAGITSRSDVAHRDVVLREILNAWRKRHEASRNVHLVWEVDRSGIQRWSTFQAAWDWAGSHAENDTGISQVWLGDDTLRYEATRWHFDTRSEFPGYTVGDSGSTAHRRCIQKGRDSRFSKGQPERFSLDGTIRAGSGGLTSPAALWSVFFGSGFDGNTRHNRNDEEVYGPLRSGVHDRRITGRDRRHRDSAGAVAAGGAAGA